MSKKVRQCSRGNTLTSSWPARNVNGRINMPSLLDMQKYYIREGLATKELGADLLVNNEYVDYATEKLGPFVVENAASKLEGCR